MLYLILGRDGPDAVAKRARTRPDHLRHVQTLQDQGRLLLAGPRPKVDAEAPGAAGFFGSLIVAEFDCLAAARAWAEADPYAVAGVFEQVEVQPFVKVFPA